MGEILKTAHRRRLTAGIASLFCLALVAFVVMGQTWPVGRAVYMVDPSAADHGVTGNGQTIKGLLSTIGTSKSATLRFRHTGVSTETLYPVLTSYNATAYYNVRFEFEEGARLAPATTKTITLPSPEHITAGPTQQIKTGAGTLVFGIGGQVSACWVGVSLAGAAAANSSAMDEAIDSISAAGGGVVLIPLEGTVSFNQFTIDQYVSIQGRGKDVTKLTSTYAGKCITMAADSGIRDVTIDGVSLTASSIGVYGGDAHRTDMRNVKIYRFETGQQIQGSTDANFYHVDWEANAVGLHLLADGETGPPEIDGSVTALSFFGCRINANTTYGLKAQVVDTQMSGLSFYNTTFEGTKQDRNPSEPAYVPGGDTPDTPNTTVNVYLKGVWNSLFSGCWFEDGGADNIQILDIGTFFATDIHFVNCRIGLADQLNAPNYTKGVNITGYGREIVFDDCFLSEHSWTVESDRYVDVRYSYALSSVDLFYSKGSSTKYKVRRIYAGTDSATIIEYKGISGGTTYDAISKITRDSVNYHKLISTVSTSNDTATPILTYTCTDDYTYSIRVFVTGTKDDNLTGGFYGRAALFECASSTATQVGATQTLFTDIEGDANWNVTMDVTGATFRVLATGVLATNIGWTAEAEITQITK